MEVRWETGSYFCHVGWKVSFKRKTGVGVQCTVYTVRWVQFLLPAVETLKGRMEEGVTTHLPTVKSSNFVILLSKNIYFCQRLPHNIFWY